MVHNAHLGVEKCKRRAKDVMFWPGMAAQITDTVLSCSMYSTQQRSNTKEPLKSRVAADLSQLNDQHYLVLVDYYSNFIEVDKLSETASEKIIDCCKCHFSRHGIPDVFVSDNGPQFSGTKFHEFSKTYQFNHRPHYPQSNGKAEKSLLQKADFQLALLDFRNTPTNDVLGSPAQRLMGRRTKTLLPTTAKLLAIQLSVVKANLLAQKETQKLYFDQHTKVLPALDQSHVPMWQNMETSKC
ncbi:uncharacterized protein K02A2.6-like [Halichondria panicea]|uniref:uncharacterized protein K02A2.6-like n=1 Tax=Halichondria panicea TaxID=6063 RepID=UPI00312B7E63